MATTDEILKRLAVRLDAIDAGQKEMKAQLEILVKRVPTASADRMRRYRQRNAEKIKRNVFHRGKRNGVTDKRNDPNSDAVAYIPVVSGEFGVSKVLLDELEAAYPQVDGPQTLKEIRAWCLTNPSKRKTARGAPRFINRWFEQVQNKG